MNNEFVLTSEVIDKVFIKTLSVLNHENDLKKFVKKFINIKSFPYINTDYGKIIESYVSDLSVEEKIEVVGHLEYLLKNINDAKKEVFMRKTDKEIEEELELDISNYKNKEELFNSYKGGEYAEMLLSQMMISLGFEKVLSKLAIQWQDLSPTGIDIPYIDIDNKRIILCESKFYKNFFEAFKSIKKDIDKINDGNKFDRELLEWKKRVGSMPESVKKWYIENVEQITTKKFFEDKFEIVVLGVTICNAVDEKVIKAKIKETFGEDVELNYKVVLLAISIEDKNKLLELCEQCTKEILCEVS